MAAPEHSNTSHRYSLPLKAKTTHDRERQLCMKSDVRDRPTSRVFMTNVAANERWQTQHVMTKPTGRDKRRERHDDDNGVKKKQNKNSPDAIINALA